VRIRPRRRVLMLSAIESRNWQLRPPRLADCFWISCAVAALRLDSTLSTGCAALAAASGKDAATLIQGIFSSGEPK
jgi:hypothetical protein